MEPPTPKQIIKKEKIFNINSDKNHSFSVNLKNLSECLEISLNFQDEIVKHTFIKKYSFEELKKINKYFLLYETIDEIYEDLILLLNKNQSKINEDSKCVKLCIPVESVKIKEIVFTLNELEKNETEQISELYSIISELKKEIKELKLNNNNKYEEEIQNLKEENKKLKEKINEFEIYLPYLKEYKIKRDEKKNNKIIRNLDSLIINNNEKYNVCLKNWINPKLSIKADLLYRASRDGEEYQTFHKLCDNKGPTVVLAKLTDGNILGTYTPLDWETKSNWKKNPDMFVFSLTDNLKSIFKNSNEMGIYCNPDYGPESHFLAFQPGHKMKEPKLRVEDSTYEKASNLVPGKKSNYYKAEEVEIFKIIIG